MLLPKLPNDCATALGLVMLVCLTTEHRNAEVQLKNEALHSLKNLEPKAGLTFTLELLPGDPCLCLHVSKSTVNADLFTAVVKRLNLSHRLG